MWPQANIHAIHQRLLGFRSVEVMINLDVIETILMDPWPGYAGVI